MTSVLPDIVGEDNLQAANGAQSIIQSMQSIIGVIAGAAFYFFFGIGWVIIINAISFAISGFSEMFIKAEFKKEKTEEEIALQKEKSMTHDFVESLRYIKKRTGLFNLVVYSLVLNFAFSPLFAIGIPYLFNNDLARVNAEMEYAYTQVAFSIAMLRAGLAVGFQTFYIMFTVGMVSLAIFMMITNIPLNTGMVKIVDPDYRGRVFSTLHAISGGAIPFAMLAGGLIIEYYSISMLGLFCVIIMLYPTAGFITNKRVKHLINSIDKKNEENDKIKELETAFESLQ